MTVLARIPGHTVAAETSQLESGVLYTTTGCTCERRGPFGGSLNDGTAWGREHLDAVLANRAREEATRGRR